MPTVAKINGVSVSSAAKVNGVAIDDIAKIGGIDVPSGVEMPSLAGVSFAAGLWGFAPDFQNSTPLISLHTIGADLDVLSTAVSPFPLDTDAIDGAGFEDVPECPRVWDQSGNGGDLTQATVAKRPSWIKDSPTVGSLECVHTNLQTMASESVTCDPNTPGRITIYALVKPADLGEGPKFLFSVGYFLNETNAAIGFYLDGTSLYAGFGDDVFKNSRVKTLSDTDWHLLTLVVDADLSGAAQTVAYLDGSTTGWSAHVSDSVTAEKPLSGPVSFGFNGSESARYSDNSFRAGLIFNDVHDAATVANWAAWFTSIGGMA